MRTADQSTRARFLGFAPFASAWPLVPLAPLAADEKYSREPLGSALMVLPPSCQFAGQTSPCSSCRRQEAATISDPDTPRTQRKDPP